MLTKTCTILIDVNKYRDRKIHSLLEKRFRIEKSRCKLVRTLSYIEYAEKSRNYSKFCRKNYFIAAISSLLY